MSFHEVPTEADAKSLQVAGLCTTLHHSSAALPLDVQPVWIHLCLLTQPLYQQLLCGDLKGHGVRIVAEFRQAIATTPLACQAILQPRMFSAWPSSLPLGASYCCPPCPPCAWKSFPGLFPQCLSRCWGEASSLSFLWSNCLSLQKTEVALESLHFYWLVCFPSRYSAVSQGNF